MTRVAVGLGSNLGDREKLLHHARNRLGELGDMVAVSSIYQTEPIGPDQPDFLNMVIVVDTDLGPADVLAALLGIETDMGRQRAERWGPRTIDLDLLLYGDQTVDQPGITVPHPGMIGRRFVLEPLLEVWPDAELPDGRPLAGFTDQVRDQRVERVTGA